MSVKEIYIMRVRKMFEELGRTPTSREMKNVSIIINKFGSWSNFIKEAGLPKVERRDFITDEELILSIQDKARELGRTPKKYEIDHCDTIKKRFGTYNNALQIAGLKPNHIQNIHNQFTEEEMLSCLKTFYYKHHKLPTQQDVKFSNEIPFSVNTLENKFHKNWSEILKSLDIFDKNYYDIDVIYKLLINECKKRKKFLTVNELNSLSKENKNIPNVKLLFKIFNVNNINEFWYKSMHDFRINGLNTSSKSDSQIL